MTVTRRTLMVAAAWAAALPAGLWRAAAQAVAGAVTAVVNTVTSRKPSTPEGSPPSQVTVGQAVEPGTAIETGRKSAVEISLADGSVAIIGQRSAAKIGGDDAMQMGQGNFRYRSGKGEGVNRALSTPALAIALKGTELVVSVDETRTICAVLDGAITCTSRKTGASVEVPSGHSVVWGAGSFGQGATPGVYRTGDVAVDDGIEAARAAWTGTPEPTPTPTPTPEPTPAPTPPGAPTPGRPRPQPGPQPGHR